MTGSFRRRVRQGRLLQEELSKLLVTPISVEMLPRMLC
uniref:HACL1 n=1 Tax=Arundo donax TaxID=35708 RepID=A0A0A9DT47_ARUDO